MTTALQLAPVADAPVLPPAVSEALAANQADEWPVSRLALADIGKRFNGWLSRMSFMLGYSKTLLNQTELFEMAQQCAAMVQRRFPAFKLSEVDLALRYGGSGEYRRDPDKPVLVAVDTVADWLRCYRDSARAEALAAAPKPEPPALPPARIDYPAEVTALVEQARAGQLPPPADLDFGNLLYDWLKAAGGFTDWRPADYYAEMQAEEAEAVAVEAADKRDTYAGRQSYNSFLAALQLGKLADNHPLSNSVVNRCRKRVLREWLLQHAADDADMPTLLAGLQTRKNATPC